MIRAYLLSGLLVLPVLVGCGGSQQPAAPQEVVSFATLDGAVDTKLAPAVKEKQQALFSILSNIREGARPEAIAQYVPNVKFSENSKQFLDGGVRLIRWKFNGAPNGDAFSVTLTIATVDAATEQDSVPKTVERVYLVTKDKKDKKAPIAVTRK